VVFHPTDKTNFKWEELPQGKTDAGGKFVVFTYAPGDGAPAGDYKVAVEYLPAGSEDGSDQIKREKGRPRVPDRYLDPNKSNLTAKVEPKSNELPPFQLAAR
jgi:hypothetical protein